MLSVIYRMLNRFKVQDEITHDMELTFEEARVKARADGWQSYAMFSIREIGGLLSLASSQVWWQQAIGWSLAGLTAGWLLSFFWPVQFTSQATLQLTPSVVSEQLLPRDTFTVDSLLETEIPALLSRGVMVELVKTLDLYPNARKHRRIEEITKEIRKSVRVERAGANEISIAFIYRDWPPAQVDREKAQLMTQALATRLIDQTAQQRSLLVFASDQFLRDRRDALGESRARLNTLVRNTPASSPQYDILSLSRDLKRKEYESAEQKLSDAEALQELNFRREDAHLEVLDAATLPTQPDTSPSLIRLLGFGSGLVVSFLSWFRRALRRPRLDLPVARATESA